MTSKEFEIFMRRIAALLKDGKTENALTIIQDTIEKINKNYTPFKNKYFLNMHAAAVRISQLRHNCILRNA